MIIPPTNIILPDNDEETRSDVDEWTWRESVGLAITVFLFAQAVAFFGSMIFYLDGERCGYRYRYHYFFPAAPVGCWAAQWMRGSIDEIR